MANLQIRNLDDNIYQRLRIRAAKQGISIEREVCQIILQAVSPDSITEIFKRNFGEANGIDLEFFSTCTT